MADITPPTLAITSSKSALKAGETALITFILTEPTADFVVSDVTVVGGLLSNFIGSGITYTATFTPTANSTSPATVSVSNGKFSDASGNFNQDGSDANNTVSMIVDTRLATYALTAASGSVNEGANAVFTLMTTNVSAGTVLTYTLSGVSESDIVGGVLTGTVTIGANGQGTITVGIAADLQTDGTDTLKVTVETASAAMTVSDTSKGIYLNGTSTNDKLVGEISNDSLYGNAGNDTLDGGAGNDYLSGGDGSDSIIGGAGDESITGGSGNDIILAGDGNDRVNYVDDSGDDTVYGGSGNDLINYSDLSGKKTILGESGNDTLYGGVDADYISGGADNDTIYGNAGSDTLDGGTGDDNLSGGDGNDSLIGGLGDDSLYGNAGVDTLEGGDGNDLLSKYRSKESGLFFGGDGADTVWGSDSNDTIDGGLGDDSLIGYQGNDQVNAGAGNDYLSGGDGNDTLDGGDGADSIYGGSGNDRYLGGAGSDYLSDSGGDNFFDAGDGNDTVYGDIGSDTIEGGLGDDSLIGWLGNDQVNAGAGNDYLSGGDGNDTLDGGDGADSLYGNAGVDTLEGGDGTDLLSKYLAKESGLFFGGDGADTVWGSDSNDTIDGGLGDDSLIGYQGNDQVNAGAGNDYLSGGDGNDTLDGGDGADSIYGGSGNDRYLGGAGSDYLSDSGGDNFFDAGDGNDTVYGDIGSDTIEGGLGDDSLIGWLGNDQVNAGAGNDYLSGGDGNDTLDGGAGNDTLFGGDGNDTLNGGAGSDSLYGGDGDDTYFIDNLNDYVYDSDGNDQAIVSVSWAKIPSSIENVTYTNGANALPYWISALIYDNASGNNFDKLIGDLNTFYYVFPTALPSYDKKAEHGLGYTAFNATQKANTQTALNYISTVLDIKFLSSNTADQPNTFAFALNNQVDTGGYAQSPNKESTGSDVFLANKDYNATLNPGTYGAMVLIHEVGHALGLKHPFEKKDADGDVATPPYLQGDEDNTRWTQMSYTQRDQDNVLSYSPLDIAALQYLYGPSKTVRTGNDSYVLKTTEANFIWDGVGNDTISAVGANQPVTLYLEPGYWSYFGAAKAAPITSAGQITINFGSVIENAIGTSAADSIFGNSVANFIEGGAGADSLSGLGGFDTLVGGAGDDILDGGGDFDVASYAKAASAYKLSLVANKISLTDPSGSEGTDTLINIERLQFADKTIRIDTKSHGSYADLPDTLYQFFVVGFGAAPGVTYMDQMAEAYRYWLPQYKDGTVKQIVEAFTTKSQFTSVYPQALYRTEGGKYYAYAHDASLAGNPLVRGAEVTKSVFDTQMASLAQGLVATIVKTSASEATKAAAAADIQAALGLGGDWTIGKVIYTVFGNLASKPLSDPTWGGTAKQFANQVAVAKYYTDTLSQSTDDVTTLRSVMAAVTNTTDVSSTDAIASLIGVALLNGPGG